VILVDNGSHDDSVDFFNAHHGHRIKVVPLPVNFGFQRGNNEGFKRSKGEYVILMNPDIAMQKKTIDQMVDYMDKHPDVALMAPQLVSPSGKVQDTYRTFYRPSDFLIKRLKVLHRIPYFKKRMIKFLKWDMDVSKVQEVDWVIGGLVIIRRSMFEEVGLFDERYFLFMGDTDLCKEFWKRGWKVVYNPHIRVPHGEARLSGNGFVKALFKKTAWIHLGDMLRYFWKWRGKWDRT